MNRCPRCGTRIFRMQSGVVKTSAVLISSDGMQSVYPSIREVPEPLRTRLVESTTGRNSGTIVIADRRGKEEIEKAERLERLQPKGDEPSATAITWPRVWPALVALIVGAAGAWFAFVGRW